MSETETEEQGQKPITSKLAIAALVTPVVLWGGGHCIFLFSVPGTIVDPIPQAWQSGWRSAILDISADLVVTSPLVGVVLSIAALIHIKHSKGRLRGKRFAIEGIIVSVVIVILTCMIGVIGGMTRGHPSYR